MAWLGLIESGGSSTPVKPSDRKRRGETDTGGGSDGNGNNGGGSGSGNINWGEIVVGGETDGSQNPYAEFAHMGGENQNYEQPAEEQPAEPAPEEAKPVVKPKEETPVVEEPEQAEQTFENTERNTRGEERAEERMVTVTPKTEQPKPLQAETPEESYDQWEQYIEQQNELEQAEANAQQPAVQDEGSALTGGYVQPNTPQTAGNMTAPQHFTKNAANLESQWFPQEQTTKPVPTTGGGSNGIPQQQNLDIDALREAAMNNLDRMLAYNDDMIKQRALENSQRMAEERQAQQRLADYYNALNEANAEDQRRQDAMAEANALSGSLRAAQYNADLMTANREDARRAEALARATSAANQVRNSQEAAAREGGLDFYFQDPWAEGTNPLYQEMLNEVTAEDMRKADALQTATEQANMLNGSIQAAKDAAAVEGSIAAAEEARRKALSGEQYLEGFQGIPETQPDVSIEDAIEWNAEHEDAWNEAYAEADAQEQAEADANKWVQDKAAEIYEQMVADQAGPSTPVFAGSDSVRRLLGTEGQAVFDYAADIANHSESDGQILEMASDLYAAMGATNPEAPGAEIKDQQKRDLAISLAKQIAADDLIEEDREPITGAELKQAYEQSVEESQQGARDITNNLISFAREDVTDPIQEAVGDFIAGDSEVMGDVYTQAAEAAIEAGEIPGTVGYDRFIDKYVTEHTPESASDKAARLEKETQAMLEQQRKSEESMRQDDRWNNIIANAENAGMPVEDYIQLQNDINKGKYKIWDAPGYNADGTPNEPLQDMIDHPENWGNDLSQLDPASEEYEIARRGNAENALHLFDTGEGFTGIVIPEGLEKFIASDTSRALGNRDLTSFAGDTEDIIKIVETANPENVELVDATDEEFQAAVNAFIKANPQLEAMMEALDITPYDIINHFFKGIRIKAGAGSGRGYGNGYGYPYRGWGGGGGFAYYGGGGGYGGYSSGGNAKQQEEQRINNIMKNWTF